VGCERIQAARDTIVEPCPERDQQVGLLQRAHRGVVPVHPGHPDGELVRVRERPACHEGGDDGDLQPRRELEQLLGRVGAQDASPGVDHGTSAGGHQFEGLLDHATVAAHRRAVARQVHVVVPLPLDRGVEHVLGDVDEHRPGPTRAGDVERLAHRARDALRGGDQFVVLGDRHGDAGDVRLLEGVGPDRAGRDLSGDRQHRDRVHVGVSESGDEVGRGGT